MSAARVMLVLPRADHVRGYQPLLDALADDPQFEPLIVTGARGESGLNGSVQIADAALYQAADSNGTMAWLSFVCRRAWRAKHLVGTWRPDIVIVPSDVSDALLAYVVPARRHGAQVVLVQGSEVFGNYPTLNARNDRAQWGRLPMWRRMLLRPLRRMLDLAGVPVAVASKGILGSRADWCCVMNAQQADVLRAAGVPSNRIVVTGAPFVDRLVHLKQQFNREARVRVRAALGLDDGRVVVFLTKSLFRLGWTNRETHDSTIRQVVAAIRDELPGWRCVIKLHPSELVSDYEALDLSDAVRIVKDFPVEDLLLASNLAISLGASSPALACPILGVPVAVVNVSGAEMLEAHERFVEQTPMLRNDQELRRFLYAQARERSVSPVARPAVESTEGEDGLASVRILNHLRGRLEG